MKGMILAAGFGTRFRPATFEIPKPLVPLCNKPLIDYAVESLLRAGVTDIVVNLHHLPDMLREHLDSEFDSECMIHFSHEEEILGTGGGIRHARHFLDDGEAFYLVNGDTIQFPPLEELESVRRSMDAVAALVLRHPPQGDRFTKVFHDRGRVTGFGAGSGEPLMFSGSHSISNRIFDLLPARAFSGITEDVYIPLLTSHGGTIAGLVHDGPWFDIGTPLRYRTASEELKQLMFEGSVETPAGSRLESGSRSLLHSEAEVEGSIDAIVAGRSRIQEDAFVAGSSLWDGVSVARNAAVRDSILCANVEVPEGSRLENAMVANVRSGIDYPDGTLSSGMWVAVPIDPDREIIFEMR